MREINEYGFFEAKSKSNLAQLHPYLVTNPTGSASWYSKNYTIISGSTWFYDYEYESEAGNQFYIGIDRFAESGSTSNNSCIYQIGHKNGTNGRVRVQGTVNLNTAIATGPVHHICFRVLSNWTGTTASSSAIIYRISLKEVAADENVKNIITFGKDGVVSGYVYETGSEVRPEERGNILCDSIVEY